MILAFMIYLNENSITPFLSWFLGQQKTCQARCVSLSARNKDNFSQVSVTLFWQYTGKTNKQTNKPKNWTSSTVRKFYFQKYIQSISRIFPYRGKHFYAMELDKTMEIEFSNFFFTIFQNTIILWKNVSTLNIMSLNSWFSCDFTWPQNPLK